MHKRTLVGAIIAIGVIVTSASVLAQNDRLDQDMIQARIKVFGLETSIRAPERSRRTR